MKKVPMRRRTLVALLLGLVVLAVLVPTASGASPPSLTSNPASWDFGTIDANTTASKTFVFTNGGGTATRSLVAALTGSSAFSITANSCTATSLGPKKSCSITVQYAPTTAGQSDSGTLTLTGKKPPASASVALTGSATALGCATNSGTGENSNNLQTIIDNASAGDTIDISGTCAGHFGIDKNLTLAGVADTSPTLDGQNNGRVLLVQSGVSVALNDLTITNGNFVLGAGILNRGTVTLNGSTSVSGNAGGSSGNGAGIANGDSVGTSTLIMNGSSSVSGNTAGIDGPGIYNNGGTVTLNDSSSVHGNSSGGSGGGIYNGGGTVTLNDSSSVYNNSSFNGGGIRSFNTLTLNDSSSVHDNTAVRGGGIYSGVGVTVGGTVTLNGSSSVYENTATGDGGGIDNHGATVSLYAASAVHDNDPNDCLNC
jgi:Cep192 domain 4